MESKDKLTRRDFVGAAAIVGGIAVTIPLAEAQPAPSDSMAVQIVLTINNQPHELSLDPRVTLLDLLRERLHLMGTKKGCDHGQCGACTVLVNGRRINSCLSLAVAHDGDTVITVEGLSSSDTLHPIQAAFIEHDGFQCGYCTPGQICSAVAMLDEVRSGVPSAVTADIGKSGPVNLTDQEIRERMAGNICRCGAYPNIVAAVRQVHQGRT